MARKKISAIGAPDEFSELEAGEKFVVTEQTTFERQPPISMSAAEIAAAIPPAPPRFVEIDDDDLDDDADDDASSDDQPAFEEDSLFAAIAGSARTTEDDACHVQIWREADEHRQTFRTPCPKKEFYGTFKNIKLSRSQPELFEDVRNEYGGGNYTLIIYLGGRRRKSLSVTLPDPPAAPTPPAVAIPATAPAPAAASVNPLEQLAEQMELQTRIKSAMFGAELRELEEYRRRDKERQTETATTENKPKEIQILEFATQVKNDKLTEKAIEFLFPAADEPKESNTLLDVAKFVFEHKEEVAGVASMIFGALLRPAAPAPAATPAPNIANMLKRASSTTSTDSAITEASPAPPAAIQPPAPAAPQSTFRKGKKEPKDNV